MLKINLFVHLNPNGPGTDDFNIENLTQEIKEDGLKSYVMEGSYPLGININGTDILEEKTCYPFSENLKSLNNLFYNVIKSNNGVESKINFMVGLGAPENYLYALKKDNKLLLSGKQGVGFTTDFEHWLELGQAVEEMTWVINEYKNICIRIAQELEPDNVKGFMENIFIKPTWNNDKWFDLEKAWKEYKTQ